MHITRRSVFSGTVSTRDLPITPHQLARWTAGTLVQDAFPHLTADDREFLMTGLTPEEWQALFAEEEDVDGHA